MHTKVFRARSGRVVDVPKGVSVHLGEKNVFLLSMQIFGLANFASNK